jgi:hypothetical protein
VWSAYINLRSNMSQRLRRSPHLLQSWESQAVASETELRREVVNAELPIVPFSAPGYEERRGQAELALASNCLLRVGEIGILCRRNQELT